jgi:hypothetical protein
MEGHTLLVIELVAVAKSQIDLGPFRQLRRFVENEPNIVDFGP